MKRYALAAALAGACLAPLSRTSAETIRMRDGSYHSGEVVSSDDANVRIRFQSGLELDLKWDQLAPGEAQRLRARAATEKAARFLVDGVVIFTKNDALEGVILEETADRVKLKTAKGTKEIAKVSIVKRDTTKINALSVYTPEEVYASKSGLYPTDTAAGNFDLGDLCLSIGLSARAREHFLKALEIDPTWKSRIDPRLASAETGVKEAEAAAMLKEGEALVAAGKLEEAVAKFQELLAKYPGTAAAVKAGELAAKGAEDVGTLQEGQKKALDLKRAKAYYDEMTSLIRKAATSKLTFQEQKEYVEKTLAGEVIAKLAAKDAMDPKTWETEWRARDLEEWRTATYGSASWMMEPNTLVIEGETSLEDKLKRQKNAQLIADLKKQADDLRKGVDAAWAKLPQGDKVAWLTAYAAEKTMVVKQPVDHPACTMCQGKGVLGTSKLCTRCLGIGKDRLVSYK
jgi:tetratricopeptide (TPR) repeat protein